MLKSIAAVASAAVIAAVFTLVTGQNTHQGALIKAAEPAYAAAPACTPQPWPYIGCAGTVNGIRVVTTDHRAS